jgi:hypothetical protein
MVPEAINAMIRKLHYGRMAGFPDILGGNSVVSLGHYALIMPNLPLDGNKELVQDLIVHNVKRTRAISVDVRRGLRRIIIEQKIRADPTCAIAIQKSSDDTVIASNASNMLGNAYKKNVLVFVVSKRGPAEALNKPYVTERIKDWTTLCPIGVEKLARHTIVFDTARIVLDTIRDEKLARL